MRGDGADDDNVRPELLPEYGLLEPHPENSLTIYNAASSQKTLAIMLVIAVIGVPPVLTYTVSIYYIFRGKTRLGSHSY